MQLVTLDSSRGPVFFEKNGISCLNLNCLVKRRVDENSISNQLSAIAKNKELNLCNLASLCFKLKVDYNSLECLNLLENLVGMIREVNPQIKLVQTGIINNLEEDLKPFVNLYSYDEENSIIYINKILKDALRFLGFVDSQIAALPTTIKNIEDYVPKDIFKYVYRQTDSTVQTYHYIKEILN